MLSDRSIEGDKKNNAFSLGKFGGASFRELASLKRSK